MGRWRILRRRVYFILTCYRLPVLATAVQDQLYKEQHPDSTMPTTGYQSKKHQPALLRIIAEELGIKVEEISDFELSFADYQPAVSL